MEQSNAHAIASINATILAISIAAFGIVVSIFGDKALSVSQEILEKQISIISLRPLNYRIPMLLLGKGDKYNTEDDAARGAILATLSRASQDTYCDPQASCPTPAEIGETFLTGLAALVSHYPVTLNLTHPANSEIAKSPSAGSLIKWWDDMHGMVFSVHTWGDYREQLLHNVRVLQASRQIPPSEVLKRHDKALNDAVKALEDAKQLPNSVENQERVLGKERLVRVLKDNVSAESPDYTTIASDILDYFEKARSDLQKLAPKVQALSALART